MFTGWIQSRNSVKIADTSTPIHACDLDAMGLIHYVQEKILEVYYEEGGAQQVYEKYGGHCAYCGCKLEKGWHVGHAEPCVRITKTEPSWKDGQYKAVTKFVGFVNPKANHLDNYMPSCPSCNINKHGDTIEQFRESIARYLKSLNLRMVQYKMAKKYGLVQETNKPVTFYFETYTSPDEKE